jgi:hypothetical protein
MITIIAYLFKIDFHRFEWCGYKLLEMGFTSHSRTIRVNGEESGVVFEDYEV